MSSVVITKSPPVAVQPSEPATTTHDLTLSTYDKWQLGIPLTVFFVFVHPIQEPVETIKRGLSQALVHYYPMAGRLALAAGEVVVRCTQLEGVAFIGASANCALKDVAQDLANPSLQEELAVFYPAAGGIGTFSDPLVMMQVTVFSCGGFVVGVTANHGVADGVGTGQFLQAVGELSRGLPSPSVLPVRQDDFTILDPPPVFAKFIEFLGSIQPSQMPLLELTVKPSLVNCIKDKYASLSSGRPCTVVEAVTAVLWRCRTRVIMSDSHHPEPEAPMVLALVASARKYAGAKEGYYGNCSLAHVVATATAGAVADGDLMDLVKMIQCAKERVPDQSDMEVLQAADQYNILSVNSWRNLWEGVDFGGGGAARILGYTRGIVSLPSCMACLPCNDEYNVFSTCVKEEHATAFRQELADMHRVYIP